MSKLERAIWVLIMLMLIIIACAPPPVTVQPINNRVITSDGVATVSGGTCFRFDPNVNLFRCEDSENYIYVGSSSMVIVQKDN